MVQYSCDSNQKPQRYKQINLISSLSLISIILFGLLPLLSMITLKPSLGLCLSTIIPFKGLLVVAQLCFPPLMLMVLSILSTLERQKRQCKSPNHCTILRTHLYILTLFTDALKRMADVAERL